MTGIKIPSSNFTPLTNIFHPFQLALPTSSGTPKLTKRPGNFLLSAFPYVFQLISKSERSIVVAWFLWNWAGDAFTGLIAYLGIALK
jgi:hypothetical protein